MTNCTACGTEFLAHTSPLCGLCTAPTEAEEEQIAARTQREIAALEAGDRAFDAAVARGCETSEAERIGAEAEAAALVG